MSIEPMKAYLLGKLDSSEADALEDRYFADREILLRLNACEQDLLDAYLSGRLPDVDRDLLEQRYLRVPELSRRLDEARRRRNRASAPSRHWSTTVLQPAFVVSLTVVILAGTWIYFRADLRTHVPRPNLVAPAVAPFVAVALTPGVVKGNGDGVEVSLPGPGTKIRFLLEVPGGDRQIEYAADVAMVEADGRRTRIWESSGALPAQPAPGGLRITIELDSALLHHADYIATLRRPGGDIIETYLFRAFWR